MKPSETEKPERGRAEMAQALDRFDFESIPVIDVAPLRHADPPARRAVDAALGAACRDVGFFLISGYAEAPEATRRLRQELLSFFDLPQSAKQRLARRRYERANRNVYRGYYHPLDRMASYKQGIDLGIERDRPASLVANDILNEPNVWPDEAALPGWRMAMCRYA